MFVDEDWPILNFTFLLVTDELLLFIYVLPLLTSVDQFSFDD